MVERTEDSKEPEVGSQLFDGGARTARGGPARGSFLSGDHGDRHLKRWDVKRRTLLSFVDRTNQPSWLGSGGCKLHGPKAGFGCSGEIRVAYSGADCFQCLRLRHQCGWSRLSIGPGRSL